MGTQLSPPVVGGDENASLDRPGADYGTEGIINGRTLWGPE